MATISDQDRTYLLSLKDSDVTKQLLIELFAFRTKTKPRFRPDDDFKLPKDRLGNPTEIKTTVGRYIFNLFIVAPSFMEHIGYQNETVTNKFLNTMEDSLSELVLDKVISTEDFIDYLNRIQWLGYVANDFMTPSMSMNVIKPNKVVNKRKHELIKINKEALDKGDAVVSTRIEKELVELAQKELAGDPTMDLYDSGAKSKFGNQYKATNIMKGAIRDNATGNYHISTTNYVDGIDKADYAYYGDTIVYAAHSRAVGTQKGGLNRVSVHPKHLKLSGTSFQVAN